jgi:hypothetical protein
MGLEAVLPPDAVDGGVPEPLRLRHRAHAPVRGGGRRGLERGVHHGLDLVRPDRGLAARAGPFVGEAGDAPAGEARAPEQHGRAAHPHLPGDGGVGAAGGGEQDDPRPLDELLGRGARAHEELEALALAGVEVQRLRGLEHER